MLYFRGCTAREKLTSIQDATEKLLKLAGVDYHVLDEEKCCGSVLLRTGFLKEAKERGIKTAIGTGTRTENAHLILNKLDIAKYVDVLVTADDVKRHKPNPDTFEKAALKMDLKNSKLYMIWV